MRRFIVILLLILAMPLSLAHANFQQLGSGDPYVDAQTGLTYAIWKPATTLNLKLSEIKLLICTVKSEQWISSTYGGKKKFLQIMESDSKAKCSDLGVGKQISTLKIGTSVAKVFAFCIPANHAAWVTCSTSDIATSGGYVTWIAPKTKLLRATSIAVLGKGLTYQEIILAARGLKLLALKK
jgi:hypothetical protein